MNKYREIDVKKQRNLTFGKTFRMCWKGILHRLLRSLLTLAVVVLAVAFFMFLLSENGFVGATARGVEAETRQARFAAAFMARVYDTPPMPVVAQWLATATDDAQRLARFALFSGVARTEVEALAKDAASERTYLRFIARVPAGKKAILFGRFRGRQALRNLIDESAFEQFKERTAPMLDVTIPDGIAALREFLDGYQSYEERLAAYVRQWAVGVERLHRESRALWGETPPETWLAHATDEQLGRWRQLLVRHGVALSEDESETVRNQLRDAALRQAIHSQLSQPAQREAWRQAFMERRHIASDEKMLRLDDPRVVEILGGAYSQVELAEISRQVAYERRMTLLERRLAGKVDWAGDGLLSPRQFFLLLISFVVCMVGIANAMLMSITERFREIATMKCLGATDRYILVQFMLEAALQGIAGGSLGMLIGFAIATLKNALLFGDHVFAYWPHRALFASAGFSLSVGVVLAVLASIYPSWAASRMAPMEAMRIE